MEKKEYVYDAFISHAVEDKLVIANELCRRLEEAGLKIWYSGRELNTGDSINNTILEGLKKSRYGIVILSKNYLDKNWTMKELHFLMSKESPTMKVILPILYDVTPEDLKAKDIDLADRYAIKADKGMDFIVEKLIAEIAKGKQKEKEQASKKLVYRWSRVAAITAMLSMGTYTGIHLYNSGTQQQNIEEVLQNHIADFQSEISLASANNSEISDDKKVSIDFIRQVFEEFNDTKSYYRNEYTFITKDTTIRFKKNVEPALNLQMNKLVPSKSYAMREPILYLLSDTNTDGVRQVKYRVENSQPLTFIKEELNVQDDFHKVRITYQNNIRSITVTLSFPDDKGIKKHSLFIQGFRPEETYLFRKDGSKWRLSSVE